MTFSDSIKTCFRKYATFSGRASRSEYWYFFLFCFLVSVAASSFEAFLNAGDPDGPTYLSTVFSLVTFLPSLSAGWRRMHDSGRSGLYLLYPMIAMIGLGTFVAMGGSAFPSVVWLAMAVLIISPFIVIWWLTRPSQPGLNEYGPNPHEVPP